MLAVPIIEEELYKKFDVIKIVHELNNFVLYTSISPIPYCKNFSLDLHAKRAGSIFEFLRYFLEWFIVHPKSPLDIVESCNSCLSYDNGFQQKVVEVTLGPYFSIYSPQDIKLVELTLRTNSYWSLY